MKGIKKFSAYMLAVAMLLTLLSGCGNTTSGNAAAPNSTDAPTPAATPTEQGDAPGKTFSVAIGENMTELHPLNQATLPGKAICFMVYDTLVDGDHAGNYTPLLAKDWSISEDGRTWTFHLRDDVVYHNGEPFTSADVETTFQLLLDNPDTMITATQYWANLESVNAIDDYTVEITLSEAVAAGIVLMGFANTFIIPDEAYAELGESLFTDQLMYGTGPWIFDEWIDGQYVHLTKNPDYWGGADSYYEDFYMRFILEASTAINAHLSGAVNAYVTTGGVDPDLVSLYNGYEDKIDLFTKSCGTLEYIGLQCGGAFQDKNIRLAFEHAIDRESIMNAIFGGGALPNSILTESCFGYDPELENYVYDPELAREELENSSYDGSEIELASNAATAKSETVLLAISEMLNKVGFNTKVSIVEGATLMDMRSTGDYDAFMVAWSHNFGDPYMFLNQRVMMDAHHTNYRNDRVNELIQASSTETDDAVRQQEIRELVRLMREDAGPYFPVIVINSTFATDKGVSGVDIYSDGIFHFRNVDYSAS